MPYGWASESTVIQSPASRAAAAEELPGALGLARERPLEEAEGEPARLELGLAEQAVGDEQERRRAVAPRRVRGSRARRPRCSGQRTP